MTKYDPYRGLKPNRGKGSVGSSVRSRWGALAAAAFGIYIYNQSSRASAASGGITQGTPRSVEFTQSAASTVVSDTVSVSAGGVFESGMMLDTSPLNISVQLNQSERGHTIRVSPEVDGLELSVVKVSTTDGNGNASITFSSEEMNVIKNSGIMVSSVTFRIVVDGAYADSVKVRCPIGA
jgi:hypothetical protein